MEDQVLGNDGLTDTITTQRNGDNLDILVNGVVYHSDLASNILSVSVRGLFRDNEICFRVRGGAGDYGGALVRIESCAVYQSQVAVRAEDGIRDLKIHRLGLGDGVIKRLVTAGRGLDGGFEDSDGLRPPPFEEAMKVGQSR